MDVLYAVKPAGETVEEPVVRAADDREVLIVGGRSRPMRRAMLMMGPQPMLPHHHKGGGGPPGCRRRAWPPSLRPWDWNIWRTGMPQARIRSGVMPPPRKSEPREVAGMK